MGTKIRTGTGNEIHSDLLTNGKTCIDRPARSFNKYDPEDKVTILKDMSINENSAHFSF